MTIDDTKRSPLTSGVTVIQLEAQTDLVNYRFVFPVVRMTVITERK